jgi:hypothetical protein
MEVVNVGLISHPMNWVTVILMLLIFSVAVKILTDWANK